ncbi:hypothetical protein FACS1894205_1850 [Alphaproteobacteria bacterium]|nr:hypothetical protein FACS1894205_1850 [Alphaproteobacteria bacterium]
MKKTLTNLLCAFVPSRWLRHYIRGKYAVSPVAGGGGIRQDFFLKQENVGKYTYYGSDLVVFSENTKIGAFCSISWGVILGPGSHRMDYLTTSPIAHRNFMGFPFQKPERIVEEVEQGYPAVVVGNDVWIGRNAVVMDGVTIGDGAVIGASAVVTKNVPPYAIVGGVPARTIRYRFDEQTIKDLLAARWWELGDEAIASLPFWDVKQALWELKRMVSN